MALIARAIAAAALATTIAVALAGCSDETLPVQPPPPAGPALRVAFASDRPPAVQGQTDVYFSDLESGAPAYLAPNLNSTSSEGPVAFSADGSLLAFNTSRSVTGTVARLFLYDVATKSIRVPQAINQLVGTQNPTLSGDGRYLASHYQVGGPFELFVAMMDITADTLLPLNRLNAPGVATFDPWLDGDGTLMVVASNGVQSMGGFDVLLYSVPLDTFLALPGLNSTHQELSPSISADGRYVAYQSGNPGGVGLIDVYVYDRQTGTKLDLPGANSALSEYQPTISADGRWLAYTTDAEGGGDVVLYDLLERRRVPLAGLNDPIFLDQFPVVAPVTPQNAARAPALARR